MVARYFYTDQDSYTYSYENRYANSHTDSYNNSYANYYGDVHADEDCYPYHHVDITLEPGRG